MDKVKYEKPMLVELGFESRVMGIMCKNGPSNSPQCKSGPTARGQCKTGASQALPTLCNPGAAAAS